MHNDSNDMQPPYRGELVVKSPQAENMADKLAVDLSKNPNKSQPQYEIDIPNGIHDIKCIPIKCSDEDVFEILDPLHQLGTVEVEAEWLNAVRDRLDDFSRINSDDDAILGVLSVLQAATIFHDYQRMKCGIFILNGIQDGVFKAMLQKIIRVFDNKPLITAALKHAKQKGFIDYVPVQSASSLLTHLRSDQEIVALSIQGRAHLGERYKALGWIPIGQGIILPEKPNTRSEEMDVHPSGYENPSIPYSVGEAAKLLEFGGPDPVRKLKRLIDTSGGNLAIPLKHRSRKYIFNLDHSLTSKSKLKPLNPKLYE